MNCMNTPSILSGPVADGMVWAVGGNSGCEGTATSFELLRLTRVLSPTERRADENKLQTWF